MNSFMCEHMDKTVVGLNLSVVGLHLSKVEFYLGVVGLITRLNFICGIENKIEFS